MKTVCKGCLKTDTEHYCPKCRRLLFDGEKISARLSFEPLSSGDKSAFYDTINKMSIPGVQVKFSVAQLGNQLVRIAGGGTHILKPIPYGPYQNLDEAPANEHLTMQIAAQIFKIPTAANGIIFYKTSDEPAYITRRFDVLPDGSKNLQEDFAQLAGRTEENPGKNYKYDSSYEEIASLMKLYVAAYKPMVEQFFRLVLFNFLFSNGDAHLKNFSLVRSADGDYVLSPAYDLMCTALHTPGERDLALENGLYERDYESPGFAHFGHYTRTEFQTFAERIGVIPRRAAAILDIFLSKADEVERLTRRSFLSATTADEYLALFHHKMHCLSATSPNNY